MKKYYELIVVPDEGYSVSIYRKAADLYLSYRKKGVSTMIIVSGATRNPVAMNSYGLKKFIEDFFKIIPINEQVRYLEHLGVKSNDIYCECGSTNTRENAINSMGVIKEFNLELNQIHVIGSVEGILRKFLTFRKANIDLGLNLKVKAISVISLFPISLLFARLLLVPGEFIRIWKYHKIGHL